MVIDVRIFVCWATWNHHPIPTTSLSVICVLIISVTFYRGLISLF